MVTLADTIGTVMVICNYLSDTSVTMVGQELRESMPDLRISSDL